MAVIEVEIRPDVSRGTFVVQVLRSAAGECIGSGALDTDALLGRMGQVQNAVLASAVTGRRVVDERELTLREVGQELFAALLGPPDVAGCYRASVALAEAAGEGLRVLVRILDPVLAALPWEAMYDQSLGAYVCRFEQLVRELPVPRALPPQTIRPPLRILGIASSPRDLPGLNVDKEKEQLGHALAPLTSSGRVELQWAPEATWASLQDVLEGHAWQVIHFVGHGDFIAGDNTGVLALVGEDGRRQLIDAEQFVDLLRRARPMPRLVVLNSCAGAMAGQTDLFAGTAAALVRAGVPAVVAMQFEITDAAAIAFSRGFYGALARARGVDDAVSAGRAAIRGLSSRTLEWVTPVLYLRGDQTQLFTIPNTVNFEVQPSIAIPTTAESEVQPSIPAPLPGVYQGSWTGPLD